MRCSAFTCKCLLAAISGFLDAFFFSSIQEDLGKFRQRVEEVVGENERVHEELSKTGRISHKEW